MDRDRLDAEAGWRAVARPPPAGGRHTVEKA